MAIVQLLIIILTFLSGFILLVVGMGEFIGSLIKGSREERRTAFKHLLLALVLLLVGAGVCALPETL